MATWWGGGTGANPRAEQDYFRRVIAGGDVTPFNGLFFNDPANDPSKRTWYNEQGMVVPGFGTGGPAGPYAQSQGQQPGGIEQLMHDLTLQRVAKTFNWQADAMPTVKTFGNGGYWWSGDQNTFAVPPQFVNRTIPGMVQQMVRGGGAPEAQGMAQHLIKGLTPEEIMRRKALKRRANKTGYTPGGGGPLPPPSSIPDNAY